MALARVPLIRELATFAALCFCAAGAWGLFPRTVTMAADPAQFPDIDHLPSQPELPDPLRMLDGSTVATLDDWHTRRKPELKALFQHYMYGPLPPPAPLSVTVRRVDRDALAGKATLKQVSLALGSGDAPSIDLLVILPNHLPAASSHPAKSPAPPVILGLNFTGNHALLRDERIQLARGWIGKGPGVVDHRATDAARGTGEGQWQPELVVDRGYALATLYYGDVMPDDPEQAAGAREFFRRQSPGGQEPGAILAWAWGLQRAVDYLLADGDVDGRSIVVYGHSRNGKAALAAAAFDERIRAAIPHQAGCGGSAPSRCHNELAETVSRINERFPHWFNAEFKRFSGREDRLPFDQHCLVALCFPRPVLFTCGALDQWANPPGQLEVLVAAGRVYRRFGVEGIDPSAAPELDRRVGQRLSYFLRDAPHTIERPDWEAFLDFADDALGPPR